MRTRTLAMLSKRISSGITPLRANSEFWDGGTIPWLKTEQLGEKNIFDTNEKITEKALAKTAIRLNPINTISIAMYGEGITRGNVSILRTEMTTNQACCNVVLDERLADYDYIYYSLKNSYLRLRGLSSGVRKNLNSGDIKGFEIAIPDTLAQQKKISGVLSALDAKIELNQRMNDELEGIAKLLYDYWFVQYDFPMSAAQAAALGKPHLQGRPYRASGGPMTYHETLKREIPVRWGVGSLNSLGEIVGGSTPSTKEPGHFTTQGTPWITPKDMSRNTGNKFISRGETDVSDEGVKNACLTILPAGTVLMSSRAPIGYTAIARNPVTTNQGFKSFVPSKGYSTEFIYYTLNHLMKVIEQNASGSTFKEVSAATLRSISTILPDSTVRLEFAKVLKPILSQQDTLEQQTQELTTLRDWLLPMLMNGQVTVR